MTGMDTKLHRYFDGDLPDGDAAELRGLLDADPALRAKLDGLREVRALVRESAAAAADVPTEDLWARIEAGIAADAVSVAPSVISDGAASHTGAARAPALEAAREARPALRGLPGGKAAERPLAPIVGPEQRRRRVATIVVAGLALAAAVLLLVLRPGESPAVLGTEAPIAVQDQATSPDPEATEVADPSAEELVFRTEVLEVDFGANSGAIFSVEGDDGAHYAVVWLADVQPKLTATE